MKTYIKYAPALLLLPFVTSCADYIDTNNFIVEKPNTLAQYEYLDAYKPLKEYIDRSAHPGFTLGTGVNAQEFLKREGVYLLTKSNYDMVTTGNAMKYASVVRDDGSMDFGTVTDFVNAAEEAGLQVYGHTLCWHAQQNLKWLNSLLADKELEVDPNAQNEVVDFELDYSKVAEYNFWNQHPDATVFSIDPDEGALRIDNPAAVGFWEVQYFTFDNVSLVKGGTYQLTVTVKATAEGAIQGNVGSWGDNSGIRIPYSTDWEEKTITFESAADSGIHGLFQTGDLVGTIWYKNIKISHFEAPAMEIGVSLLGNGDADAGENANIIARVPGAEDAPAAVVDDAKGTGKVFVNPIGANPANDWDSQFFLKSNEPLTEGTKIHVSFRYRCDDERSIGTQAHGEPGAYHHWECIGTLNATTEWQEYSKDLTVGGSHAGSEGMSSIAFNLASKADASNFYIDDVVFEKMISANSIPLTDEEKAEILEKEMERWVKGSMAATQGKVKAWDVVNEAISGGWKGDRYDLQHGTPDNTGDFFWQDYLGDNFVRIPVKYARQYFEENGGQPEDLKLFVNDYNLESDWDDNQKLKSLIRWIEQWESDGVTKIDGIGTQMHVSYHMNANTQKSKQDHIVKMFELMAKSGKLIRITELDMGICDENGKSIKTGDVTFEQEKLMADYYQFIIEKYFEIIPVAQQFGICQWAQTDSPEGSGWRGGEPIGIWTGNYQRKPAYEGWVKGLQK